MSEADEGGCGREWLMDEGEVVVTGTNEPPPRFDTCVYSSFSGGGGEL